MFYDDYDWRENALDELSYARYFQTKPHEHCNHHQMIITSLPCPSTSCQKRHIANANLIIKRFSWILNDSYYHLYRYLQHQID